VAWAGVAREVLLPTQPHVGLPAAVARIREEMAGLLPPTVLDGAPGVHPPRLFGGFQFAPPVTPAGGGGESPIADPIWEGFPAARFILPRFTLEGDGSETRLVLHHLDGEDDTGEAMLEGLAETLIRAAAFPQQGSSGPSGNGRRPGAGPADPGPVTGPAREAWSQAVEEVLEAIREGGLEKAVLARVLEVEGPVDVPGVLARFRAENARAHVYLFEPEPERALVGAAPEVLAELRGGRFHATAVAGSIPRGIDGPSDRALAERLLASGKDLAEHRHTVEVMAECLRPLMRELAVDDAPGVLTLSRIQHLETGFRGVVREGVDVLTLVEALHPTPAVCGRPRERALELIRRSEPFERGWYAGPVGWVDAAGDGDFVPALRSAVGQGSRWRLFAGAGIVDGSDPDAEWEETGLKFEPALRALGVERSP
jgi:menaquinone-specific isochorismate synthase